MSVDVHGSRQEQEGHDQAQGGRAEKNEEQLRARLGGRFRIRSQLQKHLTCMCHFPIPSFALTTAPAHVEAAMNDNRNL